MVTAIDLYERLNALYDELREAEELFSDADLTEDGYELVSGFVALINKRIHELKHTLNLLGVYQNKGEL